MNKINNKIPSTSSNSDGSKREILDVLRHRKELLDGDAKLMMTMYLENGNDYRQIARALGVSPSTIYFRIKKISKQLTGKSFHIYRNCQNKLNNRYKELARDYFLMGIGPLKLARKYRCSRYKVKHDIEKILKLVEAEQKMDPLEFHQWLIRQYFIQEHKSEISDLGTRED